MVTIRQEHRNDRAAIRDVNLRAFGQPQEADVVDKLCKNCTGVLSLVAIVENHVVGHILFSPATIANDRKTIHGMGLAPMTVLPEYQRKGIGLELIRSGIAALSRGSCAFVVVLGHPDYYPRFGFVPASHCGFGARGRCRTRHL